MAGTSDGGAEAERAFRDNLGYACDRAAPHGIAILIEPINGRDLPGYHLAGTAHALRTIEAVARPNLKLMFDCYHLQILQGDLATSLRDLLPVIGHVQMAAVPDRGEPDAGEVDLLWLMRHLEALGYAGFVGAEYRPRGDLMAGLGWLARFRG
jgi:hydroxypyruvate isomerase